MLTQQAVFQTQTGCIDRFSSPLFLLPVLKIFEFCKVFEDSKR